MLKFSPFLVFPLPTKQAITQIQESDFVFDSSLAVPYLHYLGVCVTRYAYTLMRICAAKHASWRLTLLVLLCIDWITVNYKFENKPLNVDAKIKSTLGVFNYTQESECEALFCH